MKCEIEYIGKKRNGVCQYYCKTHKAFASDSKGKILEECLCSFKEDFGKVFPLTKDIQSIKIVYENIFMEKRPLVFIEEKEVKGIFAYEESRLSYKDFGGLLLSMLNRVFLEPVNCKSCGKFHTDNGMFAYMPHRIHFCNYCGHKFREAHQNIGNELELIFNVPFIELKKGTEELASFCQIEYAIFKGEILVNGKNVSHVIYRGKEMSLQDFLNSLLELEY